MPTQQLLDRVRELRDAGRTLVTVLVARDRGGSAAGQAPLELGRQIVYGAIGYARKLGFEPHADFGRAAGYLGTWDGRCELAFGRDGKPMYISGPYDDGDRIVRKLRRGLGDGNYDFVHTISG